MCIRDRYQRRVHGHGLNIINNNQWTYELKASPGVGRSQHLNPIQQSSSRNPSKNSGFSSNANAFYGVEGDTIATLPTYAGHQNFYGEFRGEKPAPGKEVPPNKLYGPGALKNLSALRLS
eukprot:TRINITY_DN12091_c0_g1_i2.p1 TRINITY_DN12091_c0_g1~~TRINITY_DN12091_c0_g1_i2.p1  ORF type:complete len:136 (-),score=37.41 TRINITY_DN12091_c0_g1_i2:98-457(-)